MGGACPVSAANHSAVPRPCTASGAIAAARWGTAASKAAGAFQAGGDNDFQPACPGPQCLFDAGQQAALASRFDDEAAHRRVTKNRHRATGSIRRWPVERNAGLQLGECLGIGCGQRFLQTLDRQIGAGDDEAGGVGKLQARLASRRSVSWGGMDWASCRSCLISSASGRVPTFSLTTENPAAAAVFNIAGVASGRAPRLALMARLSTGMRRSAIDAAANQPVGRAGRDGSFFGKGPGRQIGDADFRQWCRITPARPTVCRAQPEQAPLARVDPPPAGQPGCRRARHRAASRRQ